MTRNGFQYLRQPISLRLVLVVPFVLQTVGAVVLVGYLSYRSGQEATETLASQLLQQTSDRVNDRLDAYFHNPQLVVAGNRLEVEQGTLNLDDQEDLRRHLWQQMLLNPSIPQIGFWNHDGHGISYFRITTTEVQTLSEQRSGQKIPLGSILFSDAAPNRRRFFLTDGEGRAKKLVYQVKDDFRTVPWYQHAKTMKQQAWTPVSLARVIAVLQVVAIAPVHDSTGKLQGFFTSAYYLPAISLFLHQLQFSPTGRVFIIEGSGDLVATSFQAEASGMRQVQSKYTRLSALKSQDQQTREAAQQLIQQLDAFKGLTQSRQLSLTVAGQRQFVQVTPYHSQNNLDWHIVTVIPESDFMAEIQENTRNTVLLCLLTLGISITSGVIIAGRVTNRISRLNQISQDLANGNLAQRLSEDSSLAEVQGLARSFNQMANQVQQSFDQIQLALEESEEKFTIIFRSSPDPIALSSLAEGRCLEANQSFLDLVGYSREELLGQCLMDLGIWGDLEDRVRFRRMMQEHGKVRNLEVHTRTRTGQIKTVLVSSELIQINGETYALGIGKDISDRKVMESQLQLYQERLNGILASIDSSIWSTACPASLSESNPQVETLYVSPGAEKIYQRPVEDFKANSQLWIEVLHPDDRQRVLQKLPQLFEQGHLSIEKRIIRPSGEIRWVLENCWLAYDEFGQPNRIDGLATDITDRKQSEIALEKALKELNYHIENSPLATIRWNRDFRVEHWSKQAEDIFGWTADEVLDKRMHDWQFIVEEDQAYVNQFASELLSGKSNLCRNRNYHKDGSILYCEWYNSALVDDAGHLISMLSLVQNVTAREQAERELQQAKEAAETANRAKSAFLANMSHELRTPLNAILGFSQLMLRVPDLSMDYQKYIGLIHNSGSYLLKLINEILDLSKVEAGKVTLNKEPIDLLGKLRAVHTLLSERINAKGLQFSLQVDPEVPHFILVDGQKLEQVLLNLLSNAVKFTQAGNIHLRVKEHDLSLPSTGVSPKCHLTFEVEDTGVGIAAQELETIFDAFAQASAGQQAREGTGLGLSISRRLVQLMGGEIAVHSALGQGSTFTFTIPVETVALPIRQAPLSQRTITGIAPNQPEYRILVVDDQAENRLLLMTLLKRIGVTAQEASTGEAALALWRSWQPHLIWMDIRLPDTNGYAVTRQIRAEELQQRDVGGAEAGVSPSTIIIALTAQALTDDQDQALAAGCNDYISKPFREEELFRKMAKHLGIQYLYGDSRQTKLREDHPPVDPPLTTEVFAVMPQEWVETFHRAVLSCEEKAVKQLLQQIPQEYSASAESLKQLAENYDFSQILDLVKPYLK